MTRLVMLLIFVSSLLNADVKVQTKNKGEMYGYKIEYKVGKLNLYPEKGDKFHVKIEISDVIFIEHQEPAQVKLLAKYYLEGKSNLIANEKGLKVFEDSYETGWGKKSAFYLAMAFIKNKQFHEAEKVLKRATVQLPGKEDKEDRKLLKLAESYLSIERGNPKFQLSDLNEQKVPKTALGKMFYYQLQGRLLEEDQKSSEALIAYYKGIMFGVRSVDRAEIQDRIENIYKNQNDPRKLPNLNNI